MYKSLAFIYCWILLLDVVVFSLLFDFLSLLSLRIASSKTNCTIADARRRAMRCYLIRCVRIVKHVQCAREIINLHFHSRRAASLGYFGVLRCKLVLGIWFTRQYHKPNTRYLSFFGLRILFLFKCDNSGWYYRGDGEFVCLWRYYVKLKQAILMNIGRNVFWIFENKIDYFLLQKNNLQVVK